MNEGIIFSNTDQKHKYLNMNITANIKKNGWYEAHAMTIKI
jgi:hypothetical protein